MSRIRIEKRDAFSHARQLPNTLFIGPAPKTRATISVPVKDGVRVGWGLFWTSLWGVVRRSRSIDFWMEGEE